jgi:probable O-glycosylation ligase (exosortase A-associated)
VTGLIFTALMLVLLAMAVMRPFVGILVWCWISFMNPHRLLGGGFGVDQPWAMLTFLATLIGCVIAREPRRPAVNGTTVLLMLLWLGTTVTSLTAMAPWYIVEPKWLQFTKVIVALLLTASLLTEVPRIHALIWAIVISLGYYGVKGGAFALVTGGNYRVFGPQASMIEDNNHLAAALLVTLPLMNYLRLHSAHALVRYGLLGAMGLTLLAIVASYSRGALLGLAALTLILWWNGPHKLMFGAFLALAVAGAITMMPPAWLDRMNTIQSYDQDTSAGDRLTMWSTSWKLALDHPLTGSGFMGPYTREVVDTVDPASPARAVHSIWFETLGEHGFPVFLVWFAITLVALANCAWLARATRNRPELLWARDLGKMVQASIVAYLVAGTFLSLSYWDGYFTILVSVAATRALLATNSAGKANRNTAADAGSWPRRGTSKSARPLVTQYSGVAARSVDGEQHAR